METILFVVGIICVVAGIPLMMSAHKAYQRKKHIKSVCTELDKEYVSRDITLDNGRVYRIWFVITKHGDEQTFGESLEDLGMPLGDEDKHWGVFNNIDIRAIKLFINYNPHLDIFNMPIESGIYYHIGSLYKVLRIK